MAEQTTSSIVIDAPAAAVMDVIADFDSYPSWAKGVQEGAPGYASAASVLKTGVVSNLFFTFFLMLFLVLVTLPFAVDDSTRDPAAPTR